MAEPSLRFPTANADRILDAVMLFGGHLAPCKTGSRLIALSISRLRPYHGLLGWIVVLLDMHGIRLNLVSSADDLDGEDNKLCYKSPGSVAYTDAYHRWYGRKRPGVCAAPPTIDLCQQTLALWLTDAIAKGDTEGPIRLTAPRMCAPVAEILAYQVRRLGLPVQVKPTAHYHALEVPASARRRAERWLEKYVPAEVWSKRKN